MNVLHLQLSGRIGGIVGLCRDINRYSENENHMFFLFEGGIVADEIAADGGHVFVSYSHRFLFIKSLFVFINYCKTHNIDVVISHADGPIIWVHFIIATYILKDVKFILYEHADIIDMFSTGIKGRIAKALLKMAYRSSDSVIAISEYVKKRNREVLGVGCSKVVVNYNGIDCDKFKVDAYQQHNIFNIIYVGRIFEKKGVHVLIDALTLLPAEIEFVCNILGDGPDFDKNVNKAKEIGLSDKVIFHGARRDVSNWLEQSDLFVHPATWEEGFGITIIESMCSGVPCIAFNKGAMPELIKNDVNGFLIENTSPEELAKKIISCYKLYKQGNYNHLRIGARKTGLQFSINTTINQLEKQYLS